MKISMKIMKKFRSFDKFFESSYVTKEFCRCLFLFILLKNNSKVDTTSQKKYFPFYSKIIPRSFKILNEFGVIFYMEYGETEKVLRKIWTVKKKDQTQNIDIFSMKFFNGMCNVYEMVYPEKMGS